MTKRNNLQIFYCLAESILQLLPCFDCLTLNLPAANHYLSPSCPYRQLKKLSEDSLTKQPEEVFDVLEKLGEG